MKRTDRLPYPGLRAYERDETDLFFGRDGCVNEMVDKLAATRFLAVLGASGAGKSSLVRTGLFDALELGFMQDAGSNWMIADFHPAGRPLRQLATALLEARDGKKPTDEDISTLETFLRRGPGSVLEWIGDGNLRDGSNLLLLADQFEELFRYGDYAGRETAEGFAALLLESARQSDRVFVVITMRSEYLGACALIPGLAEQINASLYLARRMTREECRQAIVGPARVFGFDIEPQLVTRLLNDLASFAPWEEDRERSQLHRLARQADQLPLMQHALSRLWQKAKQRNAGGRLTLTFGDYEDIGFLEGALDQHGDEVIASLSPEARPVVQAVFRALVAGSSLADAVRRPLPFARLVEIVGVDRALVAEVVDAFRASGCNFLRPSLQVALADDTMIDISHESLIRQWGRLAAWFGEESRSAATWTRLVGASDRYRAGEGGLLVGLDFANARAWYDQTKPTPGWADLHSGRSTPADSGGTLGEVGAFLAESQANAERDEREREERLEQERQQQRELLAMREQERDSLRKRYAMIVALAVVCLFAAGYFLYANAQLTEATVRAEELAAKEADARKDADEKAAEAADAAAKAAEAAAKADEAAAAAKAAAAEAKTQEEEAEYQRQRAAEALKLAEDRLDQAQVNLAKFLSYAALAEPNSALAMGLILRALPETILPPSGSQLADIPPCRTGLNCAVKATDKSVIPSAIDSFTSLAARDRLTAMLRFGARSVSFSPDGKWVTGAYGTRARVWDATTGREIVEVSHDDTVNTMAFSPDATRLVTASDDNTVRVWQVATGNELLKLTLGDDANVALFSADGTRIVTADDTGKVGIWTAATGLAITAFDHETAAQAVALSPDGLTVASGSDDGVTTLWKASNGEVIATLDSFATVSQLVFSSDGRRLLTSSWSSASLWDAATGQLIASLETESMSNFVAFSPDGALAVVGLGDSTARVWDISKPAPSPVARLRHDSGVRWVAFTPDGSRLATASYDKTARIWDTATWRETIKLTHDGGVNAVAFAPEGDRIATAAEDSVVRIWDARLSRDVARFEHETDVSVVSFSDDGKQVITGTYEKGAVVWDLATKKDVLRLPLEADSGLYDVALSPDGRHLVMATNLATGVFDAKTGAKLGEVNRPNPSFSLSFSADSRFFLAVSQDLAVRVWDVETRDEVASTTHDDSVTDASFSPDGKRFVTASYDGTSRIVDIETGNDIRLDHGAPVYVAAFSPDGTRVLTGSDDGAVRVWDSKSGKLLLLITESLTDYNTTVYDAAFSPDGIWIATSSTDGNVRIRRATTGALRLALKHDGSPYSASFSADGQSVLTRSDDGYAQVWDLTTGKRSWVSNDGESVNAVAFSRDGTHVATVANRIVRVTRSRATGDILALARAREERPLTSDEQTEYSVQPQDWEAAVIENRKNFSACDLEAGHPHDPHLGPGGMDFDEMDPVAAIAACQKAVEAFPDNARYRYQLGRALRKAENRPAAMRNMDLAATMGYPMAFYNLGIAYTNGEGVPKNPEQAVAVYRKAIELGVPAAAHNLAWTYWRGDSVKRDPEMALKLWHMAADAGHGPAQWKLAELAENTAESGRPQDLAEAFYRFALSTRFNERINDLSAATSTRYRRSTLARNLPPEVVLEQWRKAAEFTTTPMDLATLPQ